jgi:excisionase family DNA binding protein
MGDGKMSKDTLDLITLKEAMARLKVSRSTILRLLENGTYTRYRVGYGLRLDWNQVKAEISKDSLTLNRTQ